MCGVQRIGSPAGNKSQDLCLLYVLAKLPFGFPAPFPQVGLPSSGCSGARLGLQGQVWSISCVVPGSAGHCRAGIQAQSGVCSARHHLIRGKAQPRMHLYAPCARNVPASNPPSLLDTLSSICLYLSSLQLTLLAFYCLGN